MKNIAVLVSVLLLTPVFASAGPATNASEASVIVGFSTVVVAASVIASPLLIVSNVVAASEQSGKVNVEVTTEKGVKQTLALPQAAVTKANLKAGDQLNLKPTKSGAVVEKDGAVVAFLVTPDNAKLSRSNELAR